MPRSVCTILLVLVVAAGCTPAEAIEPAAAAPVPRVVEPATPAPTHAPRSEAAPGDQVLVLVRKADTTLTRTGAWDTLGMLVQLGAIPEPAHA